MLNFLFCLAALTASAQPPEQNLTDSKGKKQGQWSKLYPGTRVYQYKGQFKDDKPVGTFTYYYQSSKIKALVVHVEGTNRSVAKFYHENGVLMSQGIYRDMKKDSIWMNFSPSGRLSNKETYTNDLLNGKKTIYYIPETLDEKSQIVSAEYNYKDGKLNGESIEYFNTGSIKEKGQYLMDKKVGVWTKYNYTGAKMMDERFKNGIKHGWSYAFDDSGRQVGKQYYFEGNLLKGKALETKLKELKDKGLDPNQ